MAYEDIIASAAKQNRLDPNLIKAFIRTESNWMPNAERAEPQIKDKSYGLMQVLLGTARSVANNSSITPTQLKQPTLNILIGSKYIRMQMDKYSFDDAISAYNAGRPLYSSLPTRRYVNQDYVNKVKRNYAFYQKGWVGAISALTVGIVGFAMIRAQR